MEIRRIPGTGDAYGCDREGNVYSYHVIGSRSGRLQDEPRLMVPYTGTNNDYLLVSISLDGTTKNRLVHRLVALTWIPNPDNLPEVHHKDANIQNNCVDNLQWVDRKENLDHANIDYGALNGLRTKAKLYGPNHELIGEFNSISAAAAYGAENCGCSKSSLQKYKRSKGYEIVAEENEKLNKKKANKKIWELFDPDDNRIGEFPSLNQAGRYIKENIRDISVKLFVCQKKAYGYYVVEKECRD